jgi:hypothetical protein
VFRHMTMWRLRRLVHVEHRMATPKDVEHGRCKARMFTCRC